jgi:hypothetical protein
MIGHLRRSLPVLLIGSLLAISCAHAPAVPFTAPAWTEVPASVSEAMCGRLRNEAISPEGTIVLVRTTQPLVSASSMRSLGHAYTVETNGAAPAAVISPSLQPIPVNTIAGSCAWQLVDRLDPKTTVDTMVLQLSTPFINPFTRHEAGMLARFSIGGQASQWYWIPLGERKGQWAIGYILPLDMHES